MTKNRIIWVILWISSLVIVSFYGGVISYSFFAVVTIIPIVSLLYLVYVYFYFHIYQKVDQKRLVAKQRYPFYFTLVNDYYFLFSGIRVQFYSDFSETIGLLETTEYEFMPKSGITEETSLICKYRGEYKVGIKTVIIQDYFRLFSISYNNPEPLKVMVKPELIHLDEISGLDIKSSLKESSIGESEPDVLVREYEYGDDIRQIHWGATAKCGKPMIRKKTGITQSGIGILMSTKRTSEDIRSYLPAENKALEVDLALCLFSISKNIPVFHMHRENDMKTRYISDIFSFDEYYDFVSDIRFDTSFDDEVLYESASCDYMLMNCKTVFIILYEYSPSISSLLATFSQNNISVVIYAVSEELSEKLLSLQSSNIVIKNIHPEDNLEEAMQI